MKTKGVLLLLFILALAAVVRFAALAGPSLWDDEMHTVVFAQRPLDTMLKQSARKDSNPFGFYLLLHAWLRGGDGEAFYRFPSALFGLLVVLAMYWLGATLFDRPTALAAALLAALHPLSIYCSREVRAHTLALLCIVLATTSLLRLLARGQKRDALGYALCLGAALHTHYYAFFVLGAHALLLAFLVVRDARRAKADLAPTLQLTALASWQRNAQTQALGSALAIGATAAHRARLRGLMLALCGVAGALALFAPFFKIFAFQLLRGQSWRPALSFTEVLGKSVVYFANGATPDRLPTFLFTFDDPLRLLMILGVAAMPLIVAFTCGLRDQERREAHLLTFALFALPVALLLLALAFQPLYDVRHLLLLMPLGWLIVARGVVKMGARHWAAGVALLILILVPMLAATAQERTDPQYARQNWREAAAQVCAQARPGDLALAYHEEKAYAFAYYTKPCRLPLQSLFTDEVFAMDLAQRRVHVLPRLHEAATEHARLWLIDYHGAVYDPRDEVRAALRAEGFFLIRRLAYDRGVKRFAIDLFTRDRAEAQAAYAPEIDLTGMYNPGQLLAGWYPPGDKGAWIGATAAALLPCADKQRAVATLYVHRPFYDGPVPLRLYLGENLLAERIVEQTELVTLSGALPLDLTAGPLQEIRLEIGRTFIPADVFATADRTPKGALVQRLACE